MPTAKKVQAIEQLSEKLRKSSVAVATDFTGLTGGAMTELRRHLRARGIEYRVIKNTLTERAADAAGRTVVKEVLGGPTGLALGYGDPIQPIKVLVDYVRANRIPLVLRAAVVDGRVFQGGQLEALTVLPSRERLGGQLVGQLAAPMVRLVSVLNLPLAQMVNVLDSPLRGLAAVLRQRIAQQGGVQA
ncbi:MAG: 50S ribosomal protein L10 [Chloroflexi bacterium]|nr:50S ribosomal protein L10 [Chloroflexota bacterium]